MRFVLERVSEPEIEPVSAAEFIRNVQEFQSAATERADDITACITAAREWAEKETGRALIDQAWRLTLTDQVGGGAYDAVVGPANGYVIGWTAADASDILLRRSPAIAVTSFVSVDAAGDETMIDSDTYELREADSKWPRVVALNSGAWATGTYRLVFRAGYANRDVSPADGTSVVPARFRRAILLYAQALYDREDVSMLMDTAAKLIEPENCNAGFA